MRKIICFLVMIISFVEVVYASDVPLIKDKEFLKVDVNEELWFTPERVLYGLGENYLVYDSFYTNTISEDRDHPNWDGHPLVTYKFYDKDWNEFIEYQNLLTSKKKYFVVDNKLYVFSYDDGTKLTIYDENFNFETYNMDFYDDREYDSFKIQDIVIDDSSIYILIEDSSYRRYKEIRLYDNYSKHEAIDLNVSDLKEKFPKYYYKYLSRRNSYYAIGNDIYAISYDGGTKLIVYDDKLNPKVYNLDFYDKEFEGKWFELIDVAVDKNNIHILIKKRYNDIYKDIVLSKSDSKHEILDLDKVDVKETFCDECSQKINDDVYYDFSDKNVLISGKILVYLENGKVKFNFRDDRYTRYGQARKYNNLIIAIAYKGEKFKSDILFFDLDGNLISTYEHNAYDIDMYFNNKQLIVASLYTDGICNIVEEGYFFYNHNCNGILMNETYDFEEKYLSMALVNNKEKDPEKIENPNTLGDLHDFILLCFMLSIVVTLGLLVKRKIRKGTS